MAVTKTKKFYVGDSSNSDKLRNLGISNINDAGYDATDRSRLYMHYDSKAGQLQLNPLTDVYGRANLMGGNYTFDPKGDYLNQGPFGPTDTNPIHPGSQLTNPNGMGPMGPGGGTYGSDNLQIGFPRVSSDSSNSSNGPSCPTGFYYYDGVCVPGVNLDPSNPANVLGFNTGSGSFQNAKGVILRVITPVSTQKGALFQIVTNIQNVGHQPGKFFTKVSVPQIGLAEVESNSAFLQGGQQGVLYATLQMPATIPANTTLLTVQSDLYQSNIGNPTLTPAHDDTNTAQMPAPGTQYGMKPPTPPIPQFPVGGNTGSFGYPYNPPGNNPMPMPPPPPPPYRGFSARRSYQGYYDQQPQYGYPQQQLSPYGAQTPPGYPIYPSSPASDPYNYYQPPYQPQFLGPPIPAPQPDYYSQQQPLINIDIPPTDNTNPDIFPSAATAMNNYIPLTSTNNGVKYNGDGTMTVTTPIGTFSNIPMNGGSGDGTTTTTTTGTDFTDAEHSPVTVPSAAAGAVTGASVNKMAKRIQHDVNRQLRAAGIPNMPGHQGGGTMHIPGHQYHHHNNNNLDLVKKQHHHHNMSNLATISPEPDTPNLYRAGKTISIKIDGFRPQEPVMVQLYSTVNLMGMDRFKQLIGKVATRADGRGKAEITLDIPLTLIGKTAAIVAMGHISKKRSVELLQIVA